MKRFVVAMLLCVMLPLGAIGQSAHSATINWLDSLNPAGTTYNVYRASGSCTGTPTFAKLNTAPITLLSYTDSTVVPGQYCYYVTATIGGIESVPSNNASAAVPPFPPSAISITVK